MRKLIGSAVLAAVLLTTPGLAAAQRRRPAARPARRAAPERQVSFGVQADYGTDTDLGIGALAVIGLRSLFPKTPLDAHVTFDYFFPSAPAGASLDYWELNGNVAYRIPNLFRRLVGEGSMTASFIPVFTTWMREKPKEDVWDFANRLFWTLALLAAIITVLGIVFSPSVVKADRKSVV